MRQARPIPVAPRPHAAPRARPGAARGDCGIVIPRGIAGHCAAGKAPAGAEGDAVLAKGGTVGRAWLAAWGGFLAAAVGLAAAATLPVPPDFSYPAGNAPRPVTFSHQKHAEAKVTNCLDCHAPGKFLMKKGGTAERGHAVMNTGKSCGTCHDGTKAFGTADAGGCTRCHKAG